MTESEQVPGQIDVYEALGESPPVTKVPDAHRPVTTESDPPVMLTLNVSAKALEEALAAVLHGEGTSTPAAQAEAVMGLLRLLDDADAARRTWSRHLWSKDLPRHG